MVSHNENEAVEGQDAGHSIIGHPIIGHPIIGHPIIGHLIAGTASGCARRDAQRTVQYNTGDHLVTATGRVDFSVRRSDRFIPLGRSGRGKSHRHGFSRNHDGDVQPAAGDRAAGSSADPVRPRHRQLGVRAGALGAVRWR
jgi:hypothetical protein